VFTDTNKNGIQDTGETGISGVWVGVTKDAGATYLGFANTDLCRGYSIPVPNNMPAATTPYAVVTVPPSRLLPERGSDSISPVWSPWAGRSRATTSAW
jgi:hypothetical protein